MSNRLAQETSPYLLQHAEQPVDWYPWSEEALQRARDEDKPIFLSIGYSACHWCHVMAHESFDDPDVAAFLNEHWIAIKVDREERPDLDHVYMQAVMAMRGGQGGWPLSVFLTPQLEVFFGGTYWPPQPRPGQPGFRQVLESVLRAYQDRRADVERTAQQVTQHLIGTLAPEFSPGQWPPRDAVARVAQELDVSFDEAHGGFGRAPKFPHAMGLRVLLRLAAERRELAGLKPERLHLMVRRSLEAMTRGGMYDQLAGGFARYSVDERFLVPHFEKMLYDNALLLRVGVEHWQFQPSSEDERWLRQTADFVLREMRDPAGGFISALDADSEGEEGRFYVWTRAEIEDVLGADAADRFAEAYGVTERGNFEGRNILHVAGDWHALARRIGWSPDDLQRDLDRSRQRLWQRREERVRPAADTKVIVSWNGLMIEALAQLGAALGEPKYLDAAAEAALWIQRELVDADGRLRHSWRGVVGAQGGFVDDYSHWIAGLLALYESTWHITWLESAMRWADRMIESFADREGGGFFFSAHDQSTPITRIKDFQDNSVPSGNSMAAETLLRLAALTGRQDHREVAEATFQAAASWIARAPQATCQMLLAWDAWQQGVETWVWVPGDDPTVNLEIEGRLHAGYFPRVVTSRLESKDDTALADLWAHRHANDGVPRIYACVGTQCSAPWEGREKIVERLDASRRPLNASPPEPT